MILVAPLAAPDAQPFAVSVPPKASAVCAPHGLRFDPTCAAGCVLCRRSSLPAQSAISPALVFGLGSVAVLLLTCAAYLLR